MVAALAIAEDAEGESGASQLSQDTGQKASRCVNLESAALNELVAQLVEHRPFKALVLGSSPSELTIPFEWFTVITGRNTSPVFPYPINVKENGRLIFSLVDTRPCNRTDRLRLSGNVAAKSRADSLECFRQRTRQSLHPCCRAERNKSHDESVFNQILAFVIVKEEIQIRA